MDKTHIHSNTLKVRDLGIDAYRENIIFMRADCHVCLSEGFTVLTRLVVHNHERSIIATLNVLHSELLQHGETALSLEAMKELGIREGEYVTVSHLKPVESLAKVRAKMYGQTLNENDFSEIISDVAASKYSNIELAAFVSACAGDNLNVEEITGLTKAMVATGTKLNWNNKIIADKHCVGGLPGNRTTPIVVAIVAAAGIVIPKTSSRAITSPAGTADTMEVFTNVELSLERMKKVVSKHNGCLAWGGSVRLSPADDILISVEKALDVDNEGQMIASVLSKKAAAGSTHVLIDMPVGDTAKVRNAQDALRLQYYFGSVAQSIGLQTKVLITDGSQPVGKGIGPALEAMDVMAVLRNEKDAPADLRERALTIAANTLKLCGNFSDGDALAKAQKLLNDGTAYKKFEAICHAQGRFTEPVAGKFVHDVLCEHEGKVTCIDNRRLARIAKLAGAPQDKKAGVKFHAPLNTNAQKEQPLFSIYADSKGGLQYAVEYMQSQNNIITIV